MMQSEKSQGRFESSRVSSILDGRLMQFNKFLEQIAAPAQSKK